MILTIGLGVLAALCGYAGFSLMFIAGLTCLGMSGWVVFKGKPQQPSIWHELRFAPAILGVLSLMFF